MPPPSRCRRLELLLAAAWHSLAEAGVLLPLLAPAQARRSAAPSSAHRCCAPPRAAGRCCRPERAAGEQARLPAALAFQQAAATLALGRWRARQIQITAGASLAGNERRLSWKLKNRGNDLRLPQRGMHPKQRHGADLETAEAPVVAVCVFRALPAGALPFSTFSGVTNTAAPPQKSASGRLHRPARPVAQLQRAQSQRCRVQP